MATITFEGPNPTNPGARATTVVTITDEALLAIVEAICVTENYTGDEPGKFVIQRAVNNWMHAAELYRRNMKYAAADQELETEFKPMRQIEFTSE